MLGNYGFAWQAGMNDSNTRLMLANLSEESGTSRLVAKIYFGYGGLS